MAEKTPEKPRPDAPKPLSIVPVGEAYSNLKDDKFRWVVMVDNFGGLKKGQKVGAIHLQPGTSIERHVELGNLLPLSIEESAEASVTENPAVPPYAVAPLQPPKPDLPPDHAHTFADAAKEDDAKKAAEAHKAGEDAAKAAAAAKAKHEEEARVQAQDIARAKAQMAGHPAPVPDKK
jgi:hypothetical protein